MWLSVHCDLWTCVQLAEVEDQLFAKRVEMGGIHGPLEHRLKLMKRRDHLEKRENQVETYFSRRFDGYYAVAVLRNLVG